MSGLGSRLARFVTVAALTCSGVQGCGPAPPWKQLGQALLAPDPAPGPVAEGLSRTLGGLWNVSPAGGAAGVRFRVERSQVTASAGTRVRLFGYVWINQKGHFRTATLFVSPSPHDPYPVNAIEAHLAELSRTLLRVPKVEDVISLLGQTPRLGTAITRDQRPPWKLAEHHAKRTPVTLVTSIEPEIVAVDGFLFVALSADDAGSVKRVNDLGEDLADESVRRMLTSRPGKGP